MKWIRKATLCLSFLMLSAFVAACGPPPLPNAPTRVDPPDGSLYADINVDGKVEIYFELPEKDAAYVSKVRVYRDTSKDGKFTDKIAEFPVGEASLNKEKRIHEFHFTDTNVMPGDQYSIPFYYRFVSVGKAEVYQTEKEGEPSNVYDAKTVNADPPSYVDAEKVKLESANIEDGPQIILSWPANKENDIKGYYVFRSDKDEPIPYTNVEEAASPLIKHSAGKTLSWVDTNVQEGKPYWYVVVAIDKGDENSGRKPSTRFRGSVLAKAKLVSPEDGTSAASPTFKWESVDGARGYVVVLQRSRTGQVVWRSDFISGSTEVTYPSSADPLTPNLKYYWYVYTFLEKPASTKDAVGNSQSELWSFTAK
jgi:hypothetical protein